MIHKINNSIHIFHAFFFVKDYKTMSQPIREKNQNDLKKTRLIEKDNLPPTPSINGPQKPTILFTFFMQFSSQKTTKCLSNKKSQSDMKTITIIHTEQHPSQDPWDLSSFQNLSQDAHKRKIISQTTKSRNKDNKITRKEEDYSYGATSIPT